MINRPKPLISVIIPCYNQGRYLDQAVQSVLDQTYKNFEIIIINDGSTDEYTNELLKKYNKRNTKVYKTQNQGLASTRNYGFSLSKGEFVQFLDSDDFLDPNKFKDQMNIFNKYKDLDVSYTNYKYYYDNTKEFSDSRMEDLIGKNPFEDFVYKWQRGISIPIHCAMFKREIFNENGPFVSGFKATEDWLMWVEIAHKGCKFRYLNRDYALYRIQSNSMTRNKSFMLYWVSKAISYIENKYISDSEISRFNQEQENYFKELIDLFFINESTNRIHILEEELEKEKRKFRIIKNLSPRIKHLFDLIRRQGLLITGKNILLQIVEKTFSLVKKIKK
ncbi:MAG TPA: glycosyltransferase [Methanofastidiosum sp.]|nr:glycosyltransferase [Methanofastidiosum sp.]